DVRLAHAPGDELGVLGTEVDDQAGGELLGDRGVGARRGDLAGVGGVAGHEPAPTTTRSAFCRSLSVSKPHSAMARRNAPVRLTPPEASCAGPCRICSRVPWGSTRTRSPRGSVAWTAGMLQC